MEEPRPDAKKDESLDAKVAPELVEPDPVDVVKDEEMIPMSEMRKVRAEAAKYRIKLREAEVKVEEDEKKRKMAEMEETDRLKAEAQEAEAKLVMLKAHSDNVLRRSAVISAASVQNFQNPEDAAAILDLSELEIDDAGNIELAQVADKVAEMAKAKPYLLKGSESESPGTEFGPTSPASTNWPQPKLTTATQIDKMKKEANEFMRVGKMNSAISLYNQAWEKERGKRNPEGG